MEPAAMLLAPTSQLARCLANGNRREWRRKCPKQTLARDRYATAPRNRCRWGASGTPRAAAGNIAPAAKLCERVAGIL
eukprot:scaffold15872_cov122-Isochrysis_galbana.AAC.8